jgi:hypothetical protein
MKYMVVIPSLGRISLGDLVDQIKKDERDSGISVQIFVALNGSIPEDMNLNQVEILRISDKPVGVATAVNLALSQIEDGLVWTIADDETWLPGKFRADLLAISNLNSNSILLPSSVFNDEFGESIRPKIPLKCDEKILDYLYAHIHLGRNPRYISLSGACALRSTWRNVSFPEGKQTREDIEYLFLQERNGCRFIQSLDITVGINVELARGAKREQIALEAIGWANEWLTDRQKIGFIGCAWVKPLVYSRNTVEMRKMKKLVNSRMEFPRLIDRIRVCLLLEYWITVATFLSAVSKEYRKEMK